jgi:hypothetical protein
MRLKAVIPAAPFVVGSFLAYGWVAEKEVHIAAIVVFLFTAGSSLMSVCPSHRPLPLVSVY